VITPGCPFGCYVGVRISDLAMVETRVHELVRGSGSDCACKYKCGPTPRAACAKGKCAIEARP
jgi:hypothetical protein